MSIFNGKERYREGGEATPRGDRAEGKEINRRVKRLMNEGFEEGDAVVAAIENARRRRSLDFS